MSNPMDVDSPWSIYNPLSSKSHEIRILNLQPHVTHLCAVLETVSLTNPGEYIALSYLWGNSNSTVPMEICNPSSNVKEKFMAKANLHSALKHLYDLGHRKIWVDAICINQADDEERSLQVRNMQLIYSKAVQVIASVGEVERAEAKLIQGYFENFHWEGGIMAGLAKFFLEPYWARVWIIQELAVAEKLHLMYGGVIIAWSKVATVLRKKSVLTYPEDHASYATHIMRLRDKYQAGDPISLFKAMQWTHRSRAMIPRDKIFALLGLSSDGSRLVRLPNYSQDLWSLFTEFTVQILNMERSLDLICLGGLKRSGEGPTWVPDLLSLWSDSNPKTLLEYHILRERVSDRKFRKIPIQIQNGVLNIRGAFAGIVKNVSTTFGSQKLHDLDPHEFEAVYLSGARTDRKYLPYIMGNPLAETLCVRHNVKEREESFDIKWGSQRSLLSKVFPDYTLRDCLQMLWSIEGRGMIRSLEMIRWLDQNARMEIVDNPAARWNLREASRSSSTSGRKSTASIIDTYNLPDVRSFICYVDDVVKALSSGLLFVVTDNSFGMTPPDTQEADEVYFLEGSTYPVILRPIGNNKENYILVGASYFHTEVLPPPDDSHSRRFSSTNTSKIFNPLHFNRFPCPMIDPSRRHFFTAGVG